MQLYANFGGLTDRKTDQTQRPNKIQPHAWTWRNRYGSAADLTDLRAHQVDIVTLGQYMRPTKNHLPVDRYTRRVR